MPDAAVKSGGLDLVDDDPVGFAQRIEPLGRDLADDPDGKAGPRERLALDHRIRQAELRPDRPNFVLEEVAQRFDQLKGEVVGQAAHVVVGLDLGCGLLLVRCRGLDHIGVEGALGKEVDPAEPGGLFLEDPDELGTDDSALLLGIDDSFEFAQEPVASVDDGESNAQLFERRLEKLRLVLAHHPVVHVDAGQPVADGAVDEGRGHGRIHSSGEGAQHLAVRPGLAAVLVDAAPDLLDGRSYEVGRGPRRPGAGYLQHEVAQDLAALGRMDDLGMELDAVEPAVRVRGRGVRGRVGSGGGAEAVRQPGDRIAVAHPNRLLRLETGKEAVGLRDRDDGRPEFPAFERHHLAAQSLGHEVHAVADAQERDTTGPDGRVGVGRALFIDAGRPAGKDHAPRPAGGDLAPWSVERQQLRVDTQLANAPGDELAVLAPEVQHHDRVHGRPAGPVVAATGQIRHKSLAQRRPPLMPASSLPGPGRWLAPTSVRSGNPASSRPAGRRAAP